MKFSNRVAFIEARAHGKQRSAGRDQRVCGNMFLPNADDCPESSEQLVSQAVTDAHRLESMIALCSVQNKPKCKFERKWLSARNDAS